MKYLKVFQRLDHANQTILRVYAQHAALRTDPASPYFSSHLFLQEEIVYWLRQSADELISLASVLEEWQRTGTCPEVVPVDCIGSLVVSGNTTYSPEILRFLEALNNVSNAFKHSFINTQVSLIGAEEPVVYALGLKRNKLSNAPSFYQVTLTSLINGFNAFFSSIKQELKECKLPHQSVQQ
ncbi:MAG: hypothetical protein Q7T58_07025 [Methylotenera sp.]|nr:hypothetical protein [Methylotenera sp.]